MIEVFLGGTCNGSDWRDSLMPMLNVMFFNPVVDDWTEEAQELEKQKRKECDLILYVITPKMKGVYSIAEATYDACKKPKRTIFCVVDYDSDENGEYDFDEHQLKSLEATKELIESCGAKVCDNLFEVADYINNFSLDDLYKNLPGTY